MRRSLPKFCDGFVISCKDFEPVYIETYRSGKIWEKVERAREMLRCCRVCPRDCDVDRWNGELGTCASGRHASVASYFQHFGEEDCLRGWNGSGTIFFTHCNLKCIFCQNFDISRVGKQTDVGRIVTPEELANIMIYLQELGCHNINFVTPEHVVPQIMEAIPLAIKQGLLLPIVYNTGAYDSLDSIELMNGIVDIYMPDFKYWNPANAKRYLIAENYPDAARRSIKAMHEQVGDLLFDEDGLALRGTLLRHLVMPGTLDDTREILRWIAEHLGTNCFVNVMEQYYPAGLVSETRYQEINRHITQDEFETTIQYAQEVGLWRLDYRWRNVYAETYV
ncbi:MAG: radical SAM protein [Ignavibacteriae bacterium]|nr:radical SAM protein [Ignavibacteriota bacterium]